MTKTLFQSIELDTARPVGPTRNSVQLARSDAKKHFELTGNHCAVCRIEMVWATSTLTDADFEASA